MVLEWPTAITMDICILFSHRMALTIKVGLVIRQVYPYFDNCIFDRQILKLLLRPSTKDDRMGGP